MERCTSSKSITFRNAFALPGVDGVLPAGTYTVRTEEEMLDTLSFAGWRQIATILVLRRDGGVEYAEIDAQDLREALVRDGDQGTDPPAAPSIAMGRNRRSRNLMRRGGRP